MFVHNAKPADTNMNRVVGTPVGLHLALNVILLGNVF